MRRTLSTIVCGLNNSLCISNEGIVFFFGYLYRDCDGIEKLVIPPKAIPSLTDITAICSLNGSHYACLDSNGNVYTFGSNVCGQLGVGMDKDALDYTHIPQKVNLPPCKEVSCGDNFTICLSCDGFLYSFGQNSNGELGLGNNEEIYSSPQKFDFLENIEFIECGGHHTFCKTLNNEIYCWGLNEDGQLGLGNTENQNIPILCSSLLSEDVVDIKCGLFHSLALTVNQNVLSCGKNRSGQLGLEGAIKDWNAKISSFQKIPEFSEITRIECGSEHSISIDVHGNFYVFGSSEYSQLGLGDYREKYHPTKHPSLSNVIDISKGGESTLVKTSKNEIYGFGKNGLSQLGIISEFHSQLSPIRVWEGSEDRWGSKIIISKAKSARSIHN